MEVYPVKACSKRESLARLRYVALPFKTGSESVGCCHADKMVRIPGRLKHLFPAEVDHGPVRYRYAHP